MRAAWLLLVLLAGCADPAPDARPAADPLAALGLVPADAPFGLDGNTLCLPGEGGDDVACDPPGGSRILLGPFDAIVTGYDVVVTWVPERPTTTQLRFTVVCHESGATDDPARCEGVGDETARGSSPLRVHVDGLQTVPTAMVEVRVEEAEAVAGVGTASRQAYHASGAVHYAPEPDATNQG